MSKIVRRRLWMLLCSWLGLLGPALAAGPLVDVATLQRMLRDGDVVLLDASLTPRYLAQHIPGAVSADVFSYAAGELTPATMQAKLRAWGVSADKRVVVYDEGGSYMATRVFHDLHYHGFPTERVALLDGGLAKWVAAGGAVTKEPTPPPGNGTFTIGALVEGVRVRLPEFLVASGDPVRHALVEALEPTYHFGENKFFDRGGHVPNALMLPAPDFFNADKTFKSPAELRRMVAFLGIRPEQQVYAYCGGGVAATVPYFALKHLLGYPQVKLYRESQREWLQDERGLPMWTYSAPYLKRDKHWLAGWTNRMMRVYGVARVSVVDVRSTERYRQGHVPFALNIPAEVFDSHAHDPARLAALLGPAGVDAEHEAVIVSDGGLNERAALAFLMLERLGQKKVSILMDAVDDWGLEGMPLTKEPTLVGARKSPLDVVVAPTTYPLRPRGAGNAAAASYPKVVLAAGKTAPQGAPDAKVVHVPYTELLAADGTPKPAKDLWTILAKAGLPRYAEIVVVGDTLGEAAAGYYLLRLMGFADVKVAAGAV